jgi:NADPH-dependent glutamate synthase beta subunit-like oxidoreductase
VLLLLLQDPREFLVQTKRFVDDGNGNVKAIETVRIEWQKNDKGQVRITVRLAFYSQDSEGMHR